MRTHWVPTDYSLHHSHFSLSSKMGNQPWQGIREIFNTIGVFAIYHLDLEIDFVMRCVSWRLSLHSPTTLYNPLESKCVASIWCTQTTVGLRDFHQESFGLLSEPTSGIILQLAGHNHSLCIYVIWASMWWKLSTMDSICYIIVLVLMSHISFSQKRDIQQCAAPTTPSKL